MNALNRILCVAAAHQEYLLEAMGAGFLLPLRDDLREGLLVPAMLEVYVGDVLPSGVLAAATANRRHGATCVLSLEAPARALRELPNGGHGLPYPIPVSWITKASLPDELALRELLARVASFPDLVEDSIPLVLVSDSEQAKAPRKAPPRSGEPGGEELELGLDSHTPPKKTRARVDAKGKAERPASAAPFVLGPTQELGGEGKAVLHAVDKVGGTIVGMLWGTIWSILPERAAPSTIDSSSGATLQCASTAVPLLDKVAGLILSDPKYASDRAILHSAARRLAEMDAADGIDPTTFLGTCVDASLKEPGVGSDLRQELEEFGAGAGGVLSSQIELRPEGLSDSLHIGSRALLVFLLNPTQAGLERFLDRRPSTGKKVALLAKMLVGLYSGLAAMPKALKGRPPALLGRVAEVSLEIVGGMQPGVAISRTFSESGQRRITMLVGHTVLYEETVAPDLRLEKIAALLTGIGLTVRFESVTGALEASGGAIPGGRPVLVSFVDSSARLPVQPSLELLCQMERMPKSMSTKDGMIATLRSAIGRPVGVRVGADGEPCVSCFIQIEEREANEALVREAVKLLVERVLELRPDPNPRSRRAPKEPGASSRKRKPREPASPTESPAGSE